MTAPIAEDAKIAENYREVQARVAEAAIRSGRLPGDVRIVGVTKYVGVDGAMALFRAGCQDLGESRPQALWDKAAQMPPDVRWHLIGHLQRNKVRRTLPQVTLFHSLDSMRLAEQFVDDATSLGLVVRVLLEINLTNDASKTGMGAGEAEKWLRQYADTPSMQGVLKLDGLMGMSSLGASEEQARAEFASLRSYRDGWNQALGLAMSELSMGMSDDYEIAIEEGATLVRIGSRLFK